MSDTVRLPERVLKVLNQYQIESLLEVIEKQPDLLSKVVSLEADLTGNKELEKALLKVLLEGIIIPYNTERVKEKTNQHIIDNYHSVISVGAGESEPTYAYTVGVYAAVKKELLCSGLPYGPADLLLNTAAEQVKDNPELTELTDFPLSIKGEPARHRLLRVSLRNAVNTHCHMVKYHFMPDSDSELIVILVGDENNRLPGEAGYNDKFKQLTFGH